MAWYSHGGGIGCWKPGANCVGQNVWAWTARWGVMRLLCCCCGKPAALTPLLHCGGSCTQALFGDATLSILSLVVLWPSASWGCVGAVGAVVIIEIHNYYFSSQGNWWIFKTWSHPNCCCRQPLLIAWNHKTSRKEGCDHNVWYMARSTHNLPWTTKHHGRKDSTTMFDKLSVRSRYFHGLSIILQSSSQSLPLIIHYL